MPLPDDPFTGKPFRYEVSGNTAPPSRHSTFGRGEIPQFNIHYEVTVQK